MVDESGALPALQVNLWANGFARLYALWPILLREDGPCLVSAETMPVAGGDMPEPGPASRGSS